MLLFCVVWMYVWMHEDTAGRSGGVTGLFTDTEVWHGMIRGIIGLGKREIQA